MLDKDNIQEIYGVSPMQRNMIFSYSLNPSSTTYIEQMDFYIEGTMDSFRMHQALKQIVHKYDVFRTIYSFKSTKDPVQVVLKQGEPEWKVIDLCENGNEGYEQFKKEDLERGFDLNKDILIRGTLLKIKENCWHLIITFHHIILDGWSLGTVLEELFQLYEQAGQTQEIFYERDEEYKFSKYIKWLESKDKQQAAKYWKEYLSNYEKSVSMPRYTDIGRYRGLNFDGYKRNTYVFELSEELTAQMNTIAKENNITINALFQATWAILLQKYNYTDDVVYGMVTSGRSPEIDGVEKIKGLFINTIPIRVTTDNATDFIELCKQIQQKIICSLPYEYYPLSDIQSQSELKNQLLDHVLVFENYPLAERLQNSTSEKNNNYQIKQVNVHESTDYDLNVIVNPLKRLRITFIYNENAYLERTLKLIERNIITVLKTACVKPQIPVYSLGICSDKEYDEIKKSVELLKVDYPHDMTVDGLFREVVNMFSDKTALIYKERELTYKELDVLSDQVQELLLSKGIGEEDTIAIMSSRSVELIVVMIGILKAGAKFLILDRSNSKERFELILKDANIKWICSEDKYLDRIPKGYEVIPMKKCAEFNPAIDVSCQRMNRVAEKVAHIVYTSGSTGKPKGCIITHRNIVSLVRGQDFMNFKSEAVFLFQSNPSFDASTLEIWGALLNGGTLIISEESEFIDPEGIKKLVNGHKNTSVFLTTALFNRICDEDCTFFKVLDEIAVGGEAMNVLCVKKAMSAVPGLRISNVYGPTENTSISTSYRIEETDLLGERMPIGRPLNNSHGYVLDKGLNILPEGAVGELCLGGEGVGLGYLNRAELTKERFIQDPLYPSKFIYRTGDIVRMLPDGSFDFYNRVDSQIKLHGFRIELGEIEVAMQSLPGILQVVVMVQEIGSERYLCAYYTSNEEVDIEHWKSLLKAKLAKYMIPTFFVYLDEIPMTSNGKIDKKILPIPKLINQSKENKAQELSELAVTLRDLCAEVLGIDKENIDVHTNFFDIGITSLNILSIKNRLSKILNRDIPVAKFFEFNTIARLQEYLSKPEEICSIDIEEAESDKDMESNRLLKLNKLRRHMEDEK